MLDRYAEEARGAEADSMFAAVFSAAVFTDDIEFVTILFERALSRPNVTTQVDGGAMSLFWVLYCRAPFRALARDLILRLARHPDFDANLPVYSTIMGVSGPNAGILAARKNDREMFGLVLLNTFPRLNCRSLLENPEETELNVLCREYDADPAACRRLLRCEAPHRAPFVSELFCLVLLFCDAYLRFAERAICTKHRRFLAVACRLPMELQMMLSHRVFGSPLTFVLSPDIERCLQKITMTLDT